MNFTLKIAEIRRETLDTVTLCFKQPGLKKIKYDAGQYLTLILRINGRRFVRPYSFSSCFGVDNFIEITIKRVPTGIVSNHIIDVLKEGDIVEVMPPMGDFVFKTEKDYSHIYLWAVGSGITPILSITKYILNFEKSVIVTLVYGNRNNESTIFLNQLNKLQDQFGDRFFVMHFHTRLRIASENPYLVQGRIDESRVSSIIAENTEPHLTAHFICGPTGLKESVKRALSINNITEEQIFSEDFELIKNPNDFIDIVTRTIELDFGDEKFVLEVTKGKSILEAAIDANIELPYSCQTGNCSTCKGRLLSGKSKMIGLDKKREDLGNDDYLLCCTYPLTEDVHIKL